MAVSATWIRNNMLFSCEQYERQPTEAELKVQRSLLKLSIPDWYLNKRSNPPKILNETPIECRPPSWRNPIPQRDTSFNFSSSTLSDALPIEDQKPSSKTTNHAPAATFSRQQKSPEIRQKRSTKRAPVVRGEVFDTTIPEVKLPIHISKTFPKMSPSRKIQNINLIFPPGPKLELANDVKEIPITPESMYKTFVLKKVVGKADRKEKSDTNENDAALRKTPEQQKNDSIQAFDIVSTPMRNTNACTAFKVRTTSTPKFSPANLFSSTIIDEPPRGKNHPSQSIMEKSSVFENNSNTTNVSVSFADKSEMTPRRKLSKSLLEKALIFENSVQLDATYRSCEDTPLKVGKMTWLWERNIRSIDPILFEKDETALTSPKSTMVRDIVRKMEVSKNPNHATAKDKFSVQMKNSIAMVQEKSNFIKKQPAFLVQEKKLNAPIVSPCTRFLNSRRKSTDLENVVKNKQTGRDKSIVKGIIETLTEKLTKTSMPRQNQTVEISHQNFVKMVVNALEKGAPSKVEGTPSPRSSIHEDSSSESEVKSYTTTASHKDTDSSSDSDRRSPNFNQTFDYGTLESRKTLELKLNAHQEDDSVYWIPVSRCKLPRTSSLLSMMSRLSANGQSPCVSPIKRENEGENFQIADWGSTYKKTDGLVRKLFRIDETAVIDSGYSDRSDRSGVVSGSSVVDSTWSEDTQNDSGSETRSARLRKSLRRKSIVGHTFCVH